MNARKFIRKEIVTAASVSFGGNYPGRLDILPQTQAPFPKKLNPKYQIGLLKGTKNQ